jgi:hypothetical protein
MTTAICNGPCGLVLTCPGSEDCSIICSDDCTLCITKCLPGLELVGKTPWLLKAERIRFTGTNLERTNLAEYLGRLLDTKISPMRDDAEPVTVSDFRGTIEELLDRLELRAEENYRDAGGRS